MCLINCNIEVEENKEKKEKTDLTYEERIKIEDMLRSRTKYTIQQIADEINRNKSIVSSEIKRNANMKWDEKMAKYVRVYSAAKDRGLKQFIEDKILKEKWSPEEVAGYIKRHDIKFKIQPSFQTIYYWIENKKLKIGIFVIIDCKKKNIKLFSSNSFILILAGLVFHILGLVCISWIFVIFSGILILTAKKH